MTTNPYQNPYGQFVGGRFIPRGQNNNNQLDIIRLLLMKQKQQEQKNPLSEIGKKYLKNQGKDYLKEQFGWGSSSSTPGGAGGTTPGVGASMATAIPYLGVIAGLALGAKGAKDLLKNKPTKGWEGWGGRATLAIATGGLSEIARAGKMFGSSSHPGREMRGEFREPLRENNFLDKDNFLNFSDGSRFDFGKEGRYLTNLDNTKRQGFDLDAGDALQQGLISKVDPLSKRLVGEKKSVGHDPGYEHMTRYLINALTSGTRDQETIDRRFEELQGKVSQNEQLAKTLSDLYNSRK